MAGRRGRPEGAVAGGWGWWGARHGGTAAGPGAAIRRTQLGEHGDGVREVGWRGGRVPGSTHHLVVVSGDVGLLEEGA